MDYYFWQNSKNSRDAILYSAWPNSRGASMLTGSPISKTLSRLDISMNDRSQGRLTDNVLMTGQGRIFSRRLVELLQQLGVDNLETFPCRIRNEVTGEVHENFIAVNVVGRIACINHDASACDYLDSGSGQILSWDYLTLDESLIRGRPMFVLAQMPVQIVVHREIKEAIESAGLSGVEFVEQGNHSFSPQESDSNP